MSDSNSFLNSQPVYPFDDSKFIIAYDFSIDAINYDCVYENTFVSLYQYESLWNQSDWLNNIIEYHDLRTCNSTHFAEKDFENIPNLNEMK